MLPPKLTLLPAELLYKLLSAHNDHVVIDEVAFPVLGVFEHSIQKTAERIVLLSEQPICGFTLTAVPQGCTDASFEVAEGQEYPREPVEEGLRLRERHVPRH